MERRAERFVKRIVEQKGELLKKRPKQVARVAGKTEKKPIYKKDPSMVDERAHLKEHDGLDQLDLRLQRRKRRLKATTFGKVDESISSKFSRDIRLEVEIAEREQPDPDVEWNPDHAVEDIEVFPLEDFQSRVANTKTKGEKQMSADNSLGDQND